MSLYSLSGATTSKVYPDPSDSRTFLSFDQENLNASRPSFNYGQEYRVLEDSRRSLRTLSPAPLRVRNENVQVRPASAFELECGPLERLAVKRDTEPTRRFSSRTSSSTRSTSQGFVPRLSLPPLDDPVITKAIESSIKHARSVSLSATAEDPETNQRRPFRRWIESLNRSMNGRKAVQPRENRWPLDEFDDEPHPNEAQKPLPAPTNHRKSISWASGSSAFVTAVRSARQSLSTLSETPLHRHGRSSSMRTSTKGSYQTSSQYRPSTDDGARPGSSIDEASEERPFKRRQILDELLDSEESYLSDLKTLLSVYSTMQDSTPELSRSNMSQIQNTVNEIFVLHRELLCRLRPLIQELRPLHIRKPRKPLQRKGRRTNGSHSMDVKIPKDTSWLVNVRDSLEVTWKYTKRGFQLTAGPREAAYAATAFEVLLGRFFIYKSYGATYETMLQDMTKAAKNIPNWNLYQRGFETLANTIAPEKFRALGSKKGLALEDLLIKPIQRICKYPLLFADLLKHTPTVDDPEAHLRIEKVLFRLRETAAEINKVTNDKPTQDLIQRSWKLQDMLIFEDAIMARYILRSLGHTVLCGALHVAYQSRRSVLGEYMLCALFRSSLLLACPHRSGNGKGFQVVANVYLADTRIESTDNGRGLQCHTAPYSWKLLFETDSQLYELIFSACSNKEQEQWESHLQSLSTSQCQESVDKQIITPERFSMLSLDIKAVGRVLGHPGSLVRRLSMQRAATVGSRPGLCQVIIKNTVSSRDQGEASKADRSGAIGRSQSVVSTTNRVTILAPRRAERVRIEQDMADVWSKELLPYPGMGLQHLEQHIRASASSVLRKLSRSSLAASLGKRSASQLHEGLQHARPTLDARKESLAEARTPYGLLPVIESPIGSVKGSESCEFRKSVQNPDAKGALKRSASTFSKIKKRVSEAGVAVVSRESGHDTAGKDDSLSARGRWSIPKLPSGLTS